MNTSTLDALCEAYAQVSAVNQRAQDQLSEVADAFDRVGIPFILLKGGDLITRLYGVRGLRPIADLDLLVQERDLPTIDEILLNKGYVLQIDGNPAYHLPGGLTLDLTTSIWYLNCDEALQGLWHRAGSRRIGSSQVRVLSSADLLLHLTAYAVLYRGCLSARFTKDLSLLVEREPLDWAFLVREASQRGLKSALYHGVTYVIRKEGLHSIPADVLAGLAPSNWRERMIAGVLRKLVTEDFTYGVSFFLLFLTQSGTRRWRWLSRSFFPPPAFLLYRYGREGLRHPIRTRLRRVLSLISRTIRVGLHVIRLLLTPPRSTTP